eukprot:Awhi_evm8s5220
MSYTTTTIKINCALINKHIASFNYEKSNSYEYDCHCECQCGEEGCSCGAYGIECE